MKFYRITTCDHVHDLSGEGAYLHGGRWNSKGTRILYTAESAALAMLEALAHITMVRQHRNYCKITVGAMDPKMEWDVFHQKEWFREIFIDQLPLDWRSSMPPDALKAFGDAFREEGKLLALKVPSVLEPESYNYLLNPAHPDFAALKVLQNNGVSFDQRILKK